jgi:hypothetical protein
MKKLLIKSVGVLFWLVASGAMAVDHYVDLNCTNPVAPYTDWSIAATNIQDAIDAASAGEIVWVTNGIYATGGKVKTTTLTNRIALDKALTVQSVNGPFVTIIQGNGNGDGGKAVRCAWLTNGAVLKGFTIQGGGTRTTIAPEVNGGGVWCSSSNTTVLNCIIRNNSANFDGGGVYQGTLKNCLITSNLSENLAGGGSYGSVLNNCTLINNTNYGAYGGTLTNCIVVGTMGGPNYTSAILSYCCSTPLAPGAGNITNSPQLFPDALHLANTSPCRGSGVNLGGGTDIFGFSWSNPPSMGCAEWQQGPFLTQPVYQLTSDPVGFKIGLATAGQAPFSCFWYNNGVQIGDDGHYSGTVTTNLALSWARLTDAGSYQVVVSNSAGSATSSVVSVVIHCVDAAGTNPVPPFLSWATAATNVQAAVDASAAGDIVLVTNGLYATGGKVATGDLVSRVVVDKALLVQSVNGSTPTFIQGAWDPLTNGPTSVRCTWLTNNAVLAGFTLQGGSTRSLTATFDPQQCGGGVFGFSNSVVANCSVINCAGALFGGGVFGACLKSCALSGNQTVGVRGYAAGGNGGGAYNCLITNCAITGNFALRNGGGVFNTFSYNVNSAIVGNTSSGSGAGVYGGTLVNCTVFRNSLTGVLSGSGVVAATLSNCIVFGNSSLALGTDYGTGCSFSFCCSTPLPTGTGNISADPQLLPDGYHLATNSPCRATGATTAVSGRDMDGQSWANPPSVGCDEWYPQPAIGSQPQLIFGGFPFALKLAGFGLAGQGPFSITWSKDGSLLSGSRYLTGPAPDLTVGGFGPDDAGSYLLIASNAFGMATSAPVQVVVHCANPSGPGPVPPYTNWLTAATNLQEAVDATAVGEFVLATNGVYSTGGRVMAGDLTNRMVINKPISVFSVNGATATFIQGAWDPISTNGPGAVRCAWLADGATLLGFCPLTLPSCFCVAFPPLCDLQLEPSLWPSAGR